MAITDLVLNTDKSSTDINNDKIVIRQSERGLVLNATIKAKDGTNYDLSGKTVQFAESKDGAKLVLDENVQVDSSKQGVIHYTLHREVYSASGTAWFEIITNQGDVIDTTQNFYIDVLRDAEINVANDNYISSLNGLIAHVKVAGDKATETINNLVTQLTNDVNSKKQEADNISANLTKKFDAKMADLNNQLSDYQAKYNKLSTDWANELKTISDQATSDINAKYAQKLVDLQNDYDAWKTKTVADFNTTVDPIKKSIEQNSTDVANVTKQVQDAVAQMNTLKQEFDRVDFTKFVTGDQIKNYYTKTEVDNIVKDLQAKIATAGAVKTVDGIQPDNNGNVQTDHYTKSETTQKLATKLTFVKCGSPQAAYDASKKLADDGSIQIGIYDMNDGATSAVIGDQTVTIETLYNALNSLTTTTNSSLTDLQSQINSKTSGTIITAYDIASKTLTKETNSYTNKWLVDQYVLSQFADQINQLKGRRTVDAPDFNTLTDSGVYLISSPQNGKNFPSDSWGTLVVFNGNYGTRVAQLFVADNGTEAYVRIYGWINDAANWGNWNQIAWKSDITNLQNRIQAQQTAMETGYMKKPTVISKADYDKLATKDPNTLYEITE